MLLFAVFMSAYHKVQFENKELNRVVVWHGDKRIDIHDDTGAVIDSYAVEIEGSNSLPCLADIEELAEQYFNNEFDRRRRRVPH